MKEIGYLDRKKKEGKESIREYNHADSTCLIVFIISLCDRVERPFYFQCPEKSDQDANPLLAPTNINIQCIRMSLKGCDGYSWVPNVVSRLLNPLPSRYRYVFYTFTCFVI